MPDKNKKTIRVKSAQKITKNQNQKIVNQDRLVGVRQQDSVTEEKK